MFDLSAYTTGIVSFLTLVFASWCVGEGGEILGKKYDASIIGGLVIAWLNTAPETIFFVTALVSDNPRFAVGAVSGSSIVVCTIALAACLWIGARARATGLILLQPTVKKQCGILGISTLITISIAFYGFNMASAIVGVTFYMWFLFYSLKTKDLNEESIKEDEEMGLEKDSLHEEHKPIRNGVIYLFVGGILIILFSSPFIYSVVEIASEWKVNPILLAFFLTPVASEAPEILESISLSRKGNLQSINIAYSNLVGGTITKTTLLCGLLCIFGVYKEFKWEAPSYTLSLSLLILCAFCASLIGYFFRHLSKWHGLFLLLLFVFTGTIQYMTNMHFEEEIFPDETFTGNLQFAITS